MSKTLDLTPINAHDVGAPKPGCRFLTKCEIPDLRGKRRVPGLFWWDAYENGWTPSARVADHGEYQVPLTYVTEKPFGYYAPPEHPGLIHPAGFRGLTKLEYAVLETKTPPVAGPGEVVLFLRNGRYNQGTTSCPSWTYNKYARDFVYANTSADPGPGCGAYGEVSVPEGWDVNKDVIVVSTEESPTPAPEPEVHNPGDVSDPGPAHRFLTKTEFNTLAERFGTFQSGGNIVPGLQFASYDGGWECCYKSAGCYADRTLTHRVPNDWVFPAETAKTENMEPAGCCCAPSVFCAGAEAGTVDFAAPYSATKVVSKLAGDFSALQSRAENAEKELALLRDKLAKAEAREKTLRDRVRESAIGESERALTEIRGILVTLGQSLAHTGVLHLSTFDHALNRVARASGLPKSDVDFHFVVRNEPTK